MALLSFNGTRLIGRFIGFLSALFHTRSAKITEANIRHCFPELRAKEREQLVKQSLEHTARLLAESGIMFHWNAEKLARLITDVVGFDAVQVAVAANRGILVLVPHLGNWEFFALYFGRYNFIALYDPPKNTAIDGLIRQSRQRTGARLLPIDGQGVRGVLRALKNGEPVSILPDQVPPRSAGIYAPFFNREALTMTFAHRLIHHTRPVVFLGSCIRDEAGFTITFTEAPDDIYSDQVEVSVRAMNGAIEKLVDENRAQYQWEYKRFKKPAAGSKDLYRR
jgi:KDO2-lipid IV(A) lauroyltransferase